MKILSKRHPQRYNRFVIAADDVKSLQPSAMSFIDVAMVVEHLRNSAARFLEELKTKKGPL